MAISSRNNLIAGTFVLLTMALAVWMSFMLAERGVGVGANRFVVRFNLQDGAVGLKEGSAVLLGGQQIGRVLDVSFENAPADPAAGANADIAPVAVLVRVETRRDVALYENARVFLERPLLGNVSSINITNPGSPAGVPTPQSGSARLEQNEAVGGALAPPAILAAAGFGPEQVQQLKSTIAATESTVKRLDAMLQKTQPAVEGSLDDARAMLADVRTRLSAWAKQMDEILVNSRDASGRLNPILVKVEQGVDESRGLISDIRGTVDENRERIASIITNVESATGKLDQQVIDQVLAGLTDARGAITRFGSAIENASGMLTEQTPGLRRTFANLRVMSDQLKLLSVEVRAQPWRLLQRPNTKELETQILYDATRTYAEAASDLRATSEALEAAIGGGLEAQRLEELSAEARTAVEKYRAAERGLFDKLIDKN